MKGCKYFKYTSAVKGRVAARLITISKSTNLVVAYCATKALQASENLSIRQNGLIRFLKRDDVSDLMVNDLLHYFHRDNVAYYDEIGKSLKNICYDESITAEKKKVITLYMADHNFFSQADFLLNSLEKREYNRANAPVITGLIEALGRLHVKEAAPLIKEYLNTAETSLQITCVRALGRLGGEENLLFLLNSILRFDFTVRKEIIKVLVNNSEAGIPLLLQFLDVNQKFVSYSRDQSELTIEMEELIRKIRSTARGIRILLPAKVVNSHG
ncbi:HEAT repeat domain-containing protein [Fodinibius sediminis]|uniref:HEAT repeat-containing protein n=1 Tax=Fodinibius sediminis TaxID=1214077 RepID=A0A521D9B1_9BACT|nr:HEAT repeat domain-containing protein [Fodinibius sediminis]SMO68307.1 hypothetical protein SAMN06265218_10936 [Fodinibius sediminis]